MLHPCRINEYTFRISQTDVFQSVLECGVNFIEYSLEDKVRRLHTAFYNDQSLNLLWA